MSRGGSGLSGVSGESPPSGLPGSVVLPPSPPSGSVTSPPSGSGIVSVEVEILPLKEDSVPSSP